MMQQQTQGRGQSSCQEWRGDSSASRHIAKFVQTYGWYTIHRQCLRIHLTSLILLMRAERLISLHQSGIHLDFELL
jgi:hypothetical protein